VEFPNNFDFEAGRLSPAKGSGLKRFTATLAASKSVDPIRLLKPDWFM